MSKLRIAVLFGGVSSEYEISLKSAVTVIRSIPKDKYETVCVGITKNGRWLYYPGDVSGIENGTWHTHPDCAAAIISPDRSHKGLIKTMDDGTFNILHIDCVIPVLHGKNGEDGTIQGLLTVAGLPFVGARTLASAVCMDKEITHIVLDHAGIKTAKYCVIHRSELKNIDMIADKFISELGLPIFVKPANAGSSVGISKACSKEQLTAAIRTAFTHDGKVLCEEFIANAKEIECAVLGNDEPEPSILGEIAPACEFYDYDAKYLLGTSKLYIPARIPEETAQKARMTAALAYKTAGCEGLSRVDFFVTESNEIILNEINTLPGFTSISMYPMLWEKMGVDTPKLIDCLINLALERID